MSRDAERDPRSLTSGAVQALLRAAYFELSWGLREVARELARWRRRVQRIPDAVLRADALDALDNKRTNTDGAAVFATLAQERNRDVVQLLAVYQALWDYLDRSVERYPTEVNGRELHLALVEALEPGGPVSDYYRHHLRHDDGGYLVELVEHCRERCGRLASYDAVRQIVVAEARRAEVQALNHLPDRCARDLALENWAARDRALATGVAWFEVTAAASASLVILPLLALSSQSDLTADHARRVRASYWPWVTVVTTMLDNYADQAEDTRSGNHNYFSHYPTAEQGVERIGQCIPDAFRSVASLPNAETHAVIVAAMIAMYLSKSSEGHADTRVQRRRLVRAGGPLVALLVPALRIWRTAYGITSR